MSATATVLWFVAAALAWGCIDLGQVRAAIGVRGFVALALLAQTLYAGLGVLSGLGFLAVRASFGTRLRSAGATGATAIAVWAIVVVGVYLNIVYLPALTNPLTLMANAALTVAALAVGWLLARSRVVARVVSTGAFGASICILAAIAAGLFIATGGEKVASPAATQARADATDVFVIVIDSLRFDHTSLPPNGPQTTPRLKALAAEGMLFTRAYAQSSWTKPSVASLFSSLYPSTHGANLRRDRLPREVDTLPAIFRAAGYDTAVFSGNPWISPAFGFDEGVSYFVQSEPETFVRLVLVLRLFKLADRVVPAHVPSIVVRELENVYGIRAPKRTNCRRDAALVDAFERWSERPRKAPRFAYFHLMSPHIPYEPPGREDLFPHGDQVALLQSTAPLTPERHRLLVTLYDAAVAHGDAMVGRILDAIRAHEGSGGATVVVTADHGEEFFEHGRWGHGKSLYEEVVHVPLVVTGPGITRARRVDEPVMLVDILPTLAGAADLGSRSGWEGADLRSAQGPRSAYAELIREGGLASYALVDGTRKYIEDVASLGEPTRHELYDLAVDPAEARNLADGSIVASMQERLAERRSRAESKSLHGDAATIDEDAAQRLRALGYVN